MPERILIVDDDTLMCRLLHMALTREGYESHEVYSGPAALEYLDAHDVDLILLDIMMSDVNGFEVIRRLKKDGRHADIPIICLLYTSDAADE